MITLDWLRGIIIFIRRYLKHIVLAIISIKLDKSILITDLILLTPVARFEEPGEYVAD